MTASTSRAAPVQDQAPGSTPGATDDARPVDEQAARRAVLGRRLRWLVPLAIALLAFLVFAVVEAMHSSSGLSGTSTVQSAGFYVPTRTTPAPFSLPVLQPATSGQPAAGTTVTMSSLVGKPVVLNMWSTSCTVCKHETPAVESVASQVGGAVRFVGVDTVDQQPAALDFLHRYQVTYLQLSDPTEHVGSQYAIPGLPVTVFVSAHGKVVGEYLGALTTKTLTHYLTTLFGVRVPSG